jgi:arylsulfatase A-like enzyme
MPTAGELLKPHGFTTFAASASGIVRATPSKINPNGGFGRGFDRFDELCLNQAALCINMRFFSFLDRHRGPFFAYLHYMEPHHPYLPPRSFVPRFADPKAGLPWVVAGNPDPIEKALTAGLPPPGTPADVQGLVDHYDDEIAYWDTQLARLFDGLGKRGLLSNTLVVLAADHGEMFMEHGDIKHCRKLYDTETHTPLVVWLPGAGPRRVETPVQNVDVLPTILDVLGIDAPGWTPHGHSLAALLHGATERRLAFSAQDTLRSVNDARFKLIRDTRLRTTRLFDLDADPGEQTDVAAAHPEERDRLAGALDAWLEQHDRPNARSDGKASQDVQDALRALGYME